MMTMMVMAMLHLGGDVNALMLFFVVYVVYVVVVVAANVDVDADFDDIVYVLSLSSSLVFFFRLFPLISI